MNKNGFYLLTKISIKLKILIIGDKKKFAKSFMGRRVIFLGDNFPSGNYLGGKFPGHI